MCCSAIFGQRIARFMFLCCLLATLSIYGASAVQDAQIVWEKPHPPRAVDICSMSAGERWALTSDMPRGAGADIIIRDMLTGDILYSYHFEGPEFQKNMNIVFGKDSTTIQVAMEGVRCMLFTLETATGRVRDSFEFPFRRQGMTAMAPFQNRKRWILSCDPGLYICNVETGKTDTVFYDDTTFSQDRIGNLGGATWIGISDDETQFYTSGGKDLGDRPARLCAWDTKTLKQIYQWDDSKYFGWVPMRNPQSRYIAVLRLGKVYPDQPRGWLHDLRTGKEVWTLPNVGDGYDLMSISKDGNILGYQTHTGFSKPIRFMNIETGKVFAEYLPMNGVNVIQFLSGPTLDVFLPTTTYNSVLLRLDPATGVPAAAEQNGNHLQCTVQPNPSDGGTVVKITMATSASVTLRLVATDGSVAQDNSLGMLEAGEHSVPVHATAGRYQCLVSAGSERTSFPLIVR